MTFPSAKRRKQLFAVPRERHQRTASFCHRERCRPRLYGDPAGKDVGKRPPAGDLMAMCGIVPADVTIKLERGAFRSSPLMIG